MMDQLILASYNALNAVAIIVSVISLVIVAGKVRDRKFDGVFFWAVALTFSWLGTLGIRLWWAVWRDSLIDGPEKQWMVHHWAIPVFIGLILIGGILHVRTLTHHFMKERGWQVAGLIAATVALLTYWGIF